MSLNYLIVAPKFVSRKGDFYFFPLGLTYISASMKAAGLNVFTINLNHHDRSPREIIPAFIKKNKIDVLCVGGLSAFYYQIKELIAVSKQANPLILSIVGGGIFSSEPKLMFKALNADIGVFQEGEESIREIAYQLENENDLNSVNGIMFRDSNENIIQTDTREAIKDLDELPFPDYDGFNLAEYLDNQSTSDFFTTYHSDNPRSIPMITSRSCPYKCTFCYHPIGPKYRQRSLDNYFKELSYVVEKYRINTVEIMDELFSRNFDRVAEFCNRIKPFNLKWVVQLRVNDVTSEMVKMMKEAGCIMISLGIESASDKVLKSMKKKITVEQISNALQIIDKEEIAIQGNILFGDIAEDENTLEESLSWWKNHRKYNINLSMIEIYPGAPLFNYAFEKGLIKDKLKFITDGYPYINLTQLSDRLFNKIFKTILKFRDKGAVGKILSFKPTIEKDKYGQTEYELRVLCPHCEKISHYKKIGLHVFRNYHNKIFCRKCNRSVIILQKRLIIKKLVKDILLSFNFIKKIARKRSVKAIRKFVMG